jgi:zinc transporter 2
MNGLSITIRTPSYGSFQESGASVPQQQRHDSDHQDDKQENINISAAYVHALGDVFQSVGVIIAGALIWYYPANTHPLVQLADPIATFLFSILVLWSTVVILRSSIHVLMEGVPSHIEPEQIHHGLARINGVKSVHDLHIWSLTLGEPFLSVHILLQPCDQGSNATQKSNLVLITAQHYLRSQGIRHATIQIELDETDRCLNESCDVQDCTGYAEDSKCQAFPAKN